MTIEVIIMAVRFNLMDMSLFVNIAEENSLTRGAERSHISLSAASMRIKNLEDGVGTKLLYRTNQGVTLTPPGHDFLVHARLVLQQMENLSNDLRKHAQGVRGYLRILATTTAITEFLPPVLRTYLAIHPNVNIYLRECLGQDIVRAVTKGMADIGIVSGNVRTEDLQVLPYRAERLVLATAFTHWLAQKETVRFEETLEADYIVLPETSAIHAFVNQIIKGLTKPLKIRIQVGNFEVLCQMVEANIGIGLLPDSAAHRYVQTMKLHIIQLSDDWAACDLYICVQNIQLLPQFMRDFVDLLIADGGKLNRTA